MHLTCRFNTRKRAQARKRTPDQRHKLNALNDYLFFNKGIHHAKQ